MTNSYCGKTAKNVPIGIYWNVPDAKKALEGPAPANVNWQDAAGTKDYSTAGNVLSILPAANCRRGTPFLWNG